MNKLTLFSLLLPVVGRAEVVLDIPHHVSFFEPPIIRVTGLPALVPIIIRTKTVDGSGQALTSMARFRPDLKGVVDTRTSIANGDYEGVDPMGVFWSAKSEGRFMLPLSGSLRATIQVEDAEGRQLVSGTIDRVVAPDSVTVTNIHPPAAPFVANLYEHSGQRKRPALITLTDSNGGIDRVQASWLASQGYNVLALGYFHGEGLPDDCIEIRWSISAARRNGLRSVHLRAGSLVSVAGRKAPRQHSWSRRTIPTACQPSQPSYRLTSCGKAWMPGRSLVAIISLPCLASHRGR